MNILITGGSGGIGRETALALASNKNNQILITGRNEAALRETSELAENENISFYVIDLMSSVSITGQFREHVASVFRILDVLINNAGALVNKDFISLSDDETRLMMEVNFFAPAALIRTLLPYMRRGSHILNISSMGGYQGSSKFRGLSCYSASKAAIACLTECLAAEFSASGISVNCLALGSAQTEMLEKAFPGYRSPVTAKEMGSFVADFAVKGSKYFNGKILPVALATP